ncbi:hypothetical protein EVAR_38864_1 [Eumeta japonica]|uniref:Uncharacterized protein n=1 Tax=Eumeta variegata TaxID=151549 RepID=A0A4C1X8P4_EUMVA|nr:hypothetical protein EVAR_38864_1 [Eumeta japonica]
MVAIHCVGVFLEKDVSIAIGAVVLVAAFIISTFLLRRLFRRSKPPQPVIQVLQLDDVAREYLDTLDRKHQHHPTCSSRSASSGYSGGSLDSAPPVERSRKPIYYWEQEPPPDVTLTLHRESAV